jgi:short-subunit dehydrogenase
MDQSSSSILLLGASSDIGIALAKVAAEANCSLMLAARDSSRLRELGESLRREHGKEVEICEFDALDTDSHTRFLDQLPVLPDIVVCLVGLLGDQASAEHNFPEADLIIRSNMLGPISILGEVANRFEARGHGAIIGVSSVAGDRGRAENYLYGAAKAGLTTFLSGLRQRMGHTSIRVVTVKPGPIHTKMNAGRRRLLTAAPASIAPALLAACLQANGIVYLPWYWRPLMLLVRAIPEPLFIRFVHR